MRKNKSSNLYNSIKMPLFKCWTYGKTPETPEKREKTGKKTQRN